MLKLSAVHPFVYLTHFMPLVSLHTPDVSRGYRQRPVTWNGLSESINQRYILHSISMFHAASLYLPLMFPRGTDRDQWDEMGWVNQLTKDISYTLSACCRRAFETLSNKYDGDFFEIVNIFQLITTVPKKVLS